MSRVTCQKCGGWTEEGTDIEWPARHQLFTHSHTHPEGAPIVYRWAGSEGDRDAWSAAVAASGLLLWGFAPIGRAVVAHVSKPSEPFVRVVAESPAELVADLAKL